MREPVIVAYGRSAVGKAPRGKLKYTRTANIGAQIIKGVLGKVPQVAPEMIDDVIMGCAFAEAEQGMNIGRITAAMAGLPDSVAAQTVNRFCDSGIQSIATAHNAILANNADIILAGGAENMSLVPGGGNMHFPEPELMEVNPGHYHGMGITAENVAEEFNVSREKQDKFACASHTKAGFAQQNGLFPEIIPITAVEPNADGTGMNTFTFDKDEGIRFDTNVESLGELRTVFKKNGTVTAGNSSQTSDGSGFLLMMTREKADELKLDPIAKVLAFAAAGCPPSLMGIGPIYAIPKVLEKAGMTINDIDLIELNEAFASQSIACIEALNLPEEKINVNGGAIALGHPLGGSGTVLTAKLFSELKRRNQTVGLVSMCAGGGMGAGVIYEML